MVDMRVAIIKFGLVHKLRWEMEGVQATGLMR